MGGGTQFPGIHPNTFYCNVCQIQLSGPADVEPQCWGENRAKMFEARKRGGSWSDQAQQSGGNYGGNYGASYGGSYSGSSGGGRDLYCHLCKTSGSSYDNFQQHLRGEKHRKNVEKIEQESKKWILREREREEKEKGEDKKEGFLWYFKNYLKSSTKQDQCKIFFSIFFEIFWWPFLFWARNEPFSKVS